jgi:RNA polymerase sigma-70 factor, ECF subfamily
MSISSDTYEPSWMIVRQGSERDLILRCKTGDREAFDAVYRRFHPRIFGYCVRLLHDHRGVEDIVQTVFVKVYQSIRGLDHPDAFTSWIFAIARNEVYALIRLRQRRPPALSLDEAGDVWEEESLHESYVRHETSEIIALLLQGMKAEYREVLILRQYEQMSYAEIAAITGDSVSSVESRLFKARKALVRALASRLE